MLPFKNRLVKNSDFKIVFAKGRSIASGPVFLRFKINEIKDSRFGFAVGLKVSSSAVKRNRLKRRLREAIRENLDYIKSGFDVIIIPRGEAIKKDINWKIELEKAFQVAGLLINKNKEK